MPRGRTASAVRPRMLRNFVNSRGFRSMPARGTVPTSVADTSVRGRPGRISGRQRSVRGRFEFPPKPPPHRLGIGPVGTVRASAGRKSILPNPTLHRPLSRTHGATDGVQPHQDKRDGWRRRLAVRPPPCWPPCRAPSRITGRLPARGRMVRTAPPSPRLGSLLANVHGPGLAASADAMGHPRHLRNVIVHKPLLRLLRALHATFLPVSRHLAPRLTLR